jgi:hypothetical protein
MVLFPLLFAVVGCSSKTQGAAVLDYAKTDDYARRMFDAIATRDLNAYLDLTVKPDDLDLQGRPLMNSASVQERQRRRFEVLISSIEKEGGLHTLQWVKPGQAMGYLKEQSEFVGNIYIEVTVGADAKRMVLEIAPTQETQHRGRVLTGDAGVQLKTWEYYQTNVL